MWDSWGGQTWQVRSRKCSTAGVVISSLASRGALDCAQVSTPGFGFGKPSPLRGVELGLAAVSNRLLIPPDGFTFPLPPHCSGMLGNAWMALPLTPERAAKDGRPTGNLCWTLFLESDNFAGPVAFWIPEIWSELSSTYRTIDGRGLDSRPGLTRGAAMEVNTVPYFEAASDGTV